MRIFLPEDMIGQNELVSIDLQEQSCSFQAHMHKFIELVYIKSGTGIHTINDIEYPISRGSLLMIPCGSTHGINADEHGDMMHYNIYVKSEFFGDKNESDIGRGETDLSPFVYYDEFRASDIECNHHVRFIGREAATIESYLKFMHTEYIQKEAGYNKITESLLNIILTYVKRKVLTCDDVHIDKTKIPYDILTYITTNYSKKFSINDLAKRSFYNPSYLSRMFKEATGKSILEYVQELRIRDACLLLKQTDMSINDIAYQVGYNSPSKFYKVFKKLKGITPLRYRTF